MLIFYFILCKILNGKRTYFDKNLIFLDLVHRLSFNEARRFGNRLSFHLRAPELADLLDLFSVTGPCVIDLYY